MHTRWPKGRFLLWDARRVRWQAAALARTRAPRLGRPFSRQRTESFLSAAFKRSFGSSSYRNIYDRSSRSGRRLVRDIPAFTDSGGGRSITDPDSCKTSEETKNSRDPKHTMQRILTVCDCIGCSEFSVQDDAVEDAGTGVICFPKAACTMSHASAQEMGIKPIIFMPCAMHIIIPWF